ncbi:DExH-box ATP-dependent RNA helicase DExH17-like [Chenopodium quinoa]|uniref:DExH-box ATP-dependent RNA helicase DExH17-like n=1 Tax=Chenopodium quinoa TaxID=63459 RepID=UPI000B770EB6|nr:DExH-box ATP-dependent RNA helicase DExH17-like [Chenopodium quinoa]
MESYNLRSVLELPAPFRSTFNFRYFNSLQSECFPSCFLSDVNMVVSAPTGSGKTVLFELCILRLLSKFLSADGRFIHVKGTLKTIYIAPSKALVQEKLRDWDRKLGAWGISCLEMTGDNDSYNTKNIQEADIILTTPEKFDAVTRYKIKDGGLSFFSDIGLLFIDEVHLLNDPRGAALEAIVSRIKMLSCRPEMKSSPLAHVRFIAVSATIPNLEDLAEWLVVPPQGMKRFGEEMRPVKLTTKVLGYAAAKNDFLFEKRLQNYIFDILMQYSRGKSALVFCSTRKGAQEAAQKISQTAMTLGYSNPFIKTNEQLERLREASLSCSDKQLQSYIPYGVGYHNGGLCMKDRNIVENLFLNSDIQVLCTTNTLAHGINLPAHTVVIKSTQHYNKEKGSYTEYDRSIVLQMCGRAGRPPFDDTGLVIIMTRRETVHLYENLLNGCEVVESQLLSCIMEHLTAEIVQLTIPDITRAIEWIKCSYLYVRMKKNPETYAIQKGISRDRIESHMQDICVKKVNELSRNQLIWTDEDGFLLKPLEPGRLMTKYYLKFNTMKYIMQTQSNCSLEDALHIVCRAEELAWIQLRRYEKRLLNDVNADKDGRLRFHILGDKGKKKKRIQTREEKIFVLVNDCLTGDPLVHDLSLSQDANSICSNGCRIAKCMKEYFFFKKNYKGALNSIALAKSLHHKLWDSCPYLLKQLPGIGMVTAKALHSMGITSFETLAEADPRRIEIVANRKFPFGDFIKESLLSLPPKVEMKIEATEGQGQGKPKLAVTLTRLTQAQSNKRHYADMVVGMEEENMIIYHEKIRVDDFLSPYHTTVVLPNHLQGKSTVKANLVFEEFIGIDIHHQIEHLEEIKSNVTLRLGTKRSSSVLPPAEASPLKSTRGSVKQAKEQSTRTKVNKKVDDMPSFKLIDDEPDEGSFDGKVAEDDCKIISGSTIFDHIRKKANDFPAIKKSGAINFTTSEASTLPTKSICVEQHVSPGMIEFSEEVEGNTVNQHMVSLKRQYSGHLDINGDAIVNQETNNVEESAGVFHSRIEVNRKEVRRLEHILDHVRKRSKNLPVINTSNTKEGFSGVQGNFSDKEQTLGHLNVANEKQSYEAPVGSLIFSDPETIEHEYNVHSPAGTFKDKKRASSTSRKSLDLPFDLFNNQPNRTYTANPSLNSSLSRKDVHYEPPGDSAEPKSSITLNHLMEASRGSCSLETGDITRNVNSFLGFKSVFSFL